MAGHGGRAESAAARVTFRRMPRAGDLALVRRLVTSVQVFRPEERAVALELLAERLRVGRASGYLFWFAERGGALAGYCAYGPVPLTRSSYDLYWIAVDPLCQRQGLGRELLERAERAVAGRGGKRLYIETSSRREYARTRSFYRRCAYREVARLPDFYAPNDHKVIFCKAVK